MDPGSLVWSGFRWLAQVGKLSEDSKESEVTRNPTGSPKGHPDQNWVLAKWTNHTADWELIREHLCQLAGSHICCPWTKVLIQRQSKRSALKFWLEWCQKPFYLKKKLVLPLLTYFVLDVACAFDGPHWGLVAKQHFGGERCESLHCHQLQHLGLKCTQRESRSGYLTIYSVICVEAQQKEESMFGEGRER